MPPDITRPTPIPFMPYRLPALNRSNEFSVDYPDGTFQGLCDLLNVPGNSRPGISALNFTSVLSSLPPNFLKVSVAILLLLHCPPDPTSYPYLPFNSQGMDYDGYDALLHYIFKQVRVSTPSHPIARTHNFRRKDLQ